MAVAANQHLIVHDLVNLGAQVNTTDCWGRTPLHVCAEKGHSQVLQVSQKTNFHYGRAEEIDGLGIEIGSRLILLAGPGLVLVCRYREIEEL